MKLIHTYKLYMFRNGSWFEVMNKGAVTFGSCFSQWRKFLPVYDEKFKTQLPIENDRTSKC